MPGENFDALYREQVVNVVAALAQAVLALLAGGLAGRLSDPTASAPWIIGAIALFVGTIAAYGIATFALLLLAPIALANAAKEQPEPEPEPENDYSGPVWWIGVTTVMVAIFVTAAVAAIIVAATSDVATLGPTLGNFLLASLPVALLTIRARRIVA